MPHFYSIISDILDLTNSCFFSYALKEGSQLGFSGSWCWDSVWDMRDFVGISACENRARMTKEEVEPWHRSEAFANSLEISGAYTIHWSCPLLFLDGSKLWTLFFVKLLDVGSPGRTWFGARWVSAAEVDPVQTKS